MKTAAALILVILASLFAGCAAISPEMVDQTFDQLEALYADWQAAQTNAPPAAPDEPAPPATPPPAAELPAGFPAEIDGPIIWLRTSVVDWPVTSTLAASIGGGKIRMQYDKTRVWPVVDGVVGNPWAIVKINGQWYAGNWEYLKPGQIEKPMDVLAKTNGKGDHFKVSPLSSWTPRSGERFGLMVSALARGNLKNVKERTNVQMVTWP